MSRPPLETEETRRQERLDNLLYWLFIAALCLTCGFIGWIAQSVFGTLGAVLLLVFILFIHS